MSTPNKLPSYDDLLAQAALPRLEARVLMQVASGHAREWLIAHGLEPAPEPVVQKFRALCIQRKRGEPIAYLTGEREFFGRRFVVGPAVLIPRPETELMVEHALGLLSPNARIVDLGTGSGCIGLSLAAERATVDVTLSDVSTAALMIARTNAQALVPEALASGRLRLICTNWWQAFSPAASFELIVANPPYISAQDVHLAQGDLRFEPATALTDGSDGLTAIRSVLAGALERLLPGGTVLLEHGYDQGPAAQAVARQLGYKRVTTHYDGNRLARLLQASAT